MYSHKHTHTPFRYVAVNQVLSRGGRVLIRERQERGNARNRIAFPHRRRRLLVSAWLRRRINRGSISRRCFSPIYPFIQEESQIFAQPFERKKSAIVYFFLKCCKTPLLYLTRPSCDPINPSILIAYTLIVFDIPFVGHAIISRYRSMSPDIKSEIYRRGGTFPFGRSLNAPRNRREEEMRAGAAR